MPNDDELPDLPGPAPRRDAGDDERGSPPGEADRRDFVRRHTAWTRPPLVPEVELLLAVEPTALWHATEAWLDARGVPPPFWAFAWAGGQALARFVLDHPDRVRGGRVLDFACGSGLCAIAATIAGAAVVRAADLDAFATTAARMNAERAGFALDVTADDLVGAPLESFDVVLAGDVFYDAGMSQKVVPWLAALAASGKGVLAGDPQRTYRPVANKEAGDPVIEVARYRVPTPVALEGASFKEASVLQFAARRGPGTQ